MDRCKPSRIELCLAVMLVASLLLALGCESAQQKRARMEQSGWESARQQNTMEAYAAFQKAFPHGPHADQASHKLALLAWDDAKSRDTQTAYREFVKTFPKSQFFEEANARSQDFGVKVVGRGAVDTVRATTATGPIVEIVPQWKERLVTLDRDSVYATGKDGARVDLSCLVPIQARGYALRIQPYADRLEPGGRYGKETVIPGKNTFTKLNVNVFCTNKGQTYFEIEIDKGKAPVRFGLVFAMNYDKLKMLHLLGTEMATSATKR